MGHFLIGVIDYLALELVTHPDTPPLQTGDVDTEIAYWRRRVVETCIYGVDKNPMAVELAKVSLWLPHRIKREAAFIFGSPYPVWKFVSWGKYSESREFTCNSKRLDVPRKPPNLLSIWFSSSRTLSLKQSDTIS